MFLSLYCASVRQLDGKTISLGYVSCLPNLAPVPMLISDAASSDPCA